ncbi:ligase-associated DNA damage response endonuclease PdeM [Stenotrophomonas maltophilia]|uniref:ligase-associated DNA damage response endonuclease PdeM n=1 Tax=Stenotrophomonas TaxID=40323 RepID=UPI000D0B8482|nr:MULTISPECIES: ligase-associated DNA damage response endonuclease PdeM [Stenotrophomonas]AVO31489.1 phosphoesterase [Stenotrophomonas maltophilia]ELC7322889.1 ligase-associated DNA damage response endonuclease PdeM [Stenotrophomonas maltophilia]MBA0279299.1 ligase-associated DNA damage response endonuclease PdeM [Stenotrophomonas maltophilia]MBA0414879.1 ligase-associated DNA damage response endonuclease PdeM [Stenotrophomonas maltophilia]MBA0500284.1 ligase-associated DNA damage response en
MADELPLLRAGESLILLGARALYWPARQALLIADLHLGKADVFRRSGIALPAGGTRTDLQRLQSLLDTYTCRELWILGDILHGPAHRAAWYQQWLAWRERNAALDVHVLRGNHDRQLPHAQLQVHIHDEVRLQPFLLRHEPMPDAALHVIAGHLHPQIALPPLRRRFPAFWLRERMTILPAFSAFTAGIMPAPAHSERMIACVEDGLVELPVR